MSADDDRYVVIPWHELSADALRGVVEEFVTRDGTDYGETEVSLEHKLEQVLTAVKKGRALIVFDTTMEHTTIVDRESFRP